MYEHVRERLIESGVLRVEGDRIVMTRDYVFGSPSRAAVLLLGRSANGWREWKNAKGQTLNRVKRVGMTDEAIREGYGDQGAAPEVLVFVVLGEPRPHGTALTNVQQGALALLRGPHEIIHTDLLGFGHLQEFGEETSRHLDDTDDARGDFGDADALRVTGGQEDLDGLGAGHSSSNP